MCLSWTEICFSQTQICLSQAQMRRLACPKSKKIVTNGVPMARHRPILREHGDTASGTLFKHLLSPPGSVFVAKTASKTKQQKIIVKHNL